ncbi:MAG: hypothetical protein JWM56_1340 [Candidatus Peribacteria bacterium]|nr:hypothetical protein [Candidatus Peribacteria bacterium]
MGNSDYTPAQSRCKGAMIIFRLAQVILFCICFIQAKKSEYKEYFTIYQNEMLFAIDDHKLNIVNGTNIRLYHQKTHIKAPSCTPDD